jgi:hypothetical protein
LGNGSVTLPERSPEENPDERTTATPVLSTIAPSTTTRGSSSSTSSISTHIAPGSHAIATRAGQRFSLQSSMTAPVARTYTPAAYAPLPSGRNKDLPPLAEIPRVYSLPNGVSRTTSSTSPTAVNMGSAGESASILKQVNEARSSLTGINRVALPSGRVLIHRDGSLDVIPAPGRRVQVRADGTLASISGRFDPSAILKTDSPGQSRSPIPAMDRVSFNARGGISAIHTHSLDIYHGPHGVRTIVQYRPDQSILVSTGRHSGYLEDTIHQNGQSFTRRSYVSGKTVATHIYSPYHFHGQTLQHYLPAQYSPAFYSWVYAVWGGPVRFPWRWRKPTWVTFYKPYYVVSPYYLDANLWLTDYIFADTFQGNDDAQDGGAYAPSGDDDSTGDPNAVYSDSDAAVTPSLKQAIAAQVQQQLAYESSAAGDPSQVAQDTDLPQAMQPNHYFVVANPLDVITEDGHTCTLDSGNILKLISQPASDSTIAKLTVSASRRTDCPADTTVSVSLDQLEEMQNSFRERLDGGLQTLFQQQGQGGLPSAPPDALTPPRPAYVPPAVPQYVPQLLDEVQSQAGTTEAEALRFTKSQLDAAGQQAGNP